MTSVLEVLHHPKQTQVLDWKFQITENVSSFVSFTGNTWADILPILEEQGRGAEAANTIFRQAFTREQVQTSQFNGKAERFTLVLLTLRVWRQKRRSVTKNSTDFILKVGQIGDTSILSYTTGSSGCAPSSHGWDLVTKTNISLFGPNNTGQQVYLYHVSEFLFSL